MSDKHGWISVEERLPPYDHKVLIAGVAGIRRIAYYDPFNDQWREQETDRRIVVTHWRELPPPPEAP